MLSPRRGLGGLVSSRFFQSSRLRLRLESLSRLLNRGLLLVDDNRRRRRGLVLCHTQKPLGGEGIGKDYFHSRRVP